MIKSGDKNKLRLKFTGINWHRDFESIFFCEIFLFLFNGWLQIIYVDPHKFAVVTEITIAELSVQIFLINIILLTPVWH